VPIAISCTTAAVNEMLRIAHDPAKVQIKTELTKKMSLILYMTLYGECMKLPDSR